MLFSVSSKLLVSSPASQGWASICASCILSPGRTRRQERTRFWHSSDTRDRKHSSALQISSSVSKGMSPEIQQI